MNLFDDLNENEKELIGREKIENGDVDDIGAEIERLEGFPERDRDEDEKEIIDGMKKKFNLF